MKDFKAGDLVQVIAGAPYVDSDWHLTVGVVQHTSPLWGTRIKVIRHNDPYYVDHNIAFDTDGLEKLPSIYLCELERLIYGIK